METDTEMLEVRQGIHAGSGKGLPDDAALQHALHDLNNV